MQSEIKENPSSCITIEIVNVVASCNLGRTIHLVEFSASDGISSHCGSYDRTVFVGLVLRYPAIAPITATLFSNGKFILTGGKDETQIKNAAEVVANLVNAFEASRNEIL